MNGYGFFASLRFLGFLGTVFLGSVILFSVFIYNQISTELRFRHTYGENWKAQYEEVHEPLAHTHAKIGAAAGGIISECVLMVWLLRQMQPGAHASRPSSGRSGGRRRRHGSPLERAASNRKNAILGIYFGVAAILVGVLLVIFRMGIFRDHANESVLGIFVFLLGYVGAITGCSYWLKAKGQSEGIVFIALMPLAILAIPFVRLIFLAAPGLLALGMVMMPIILIVVVAVLPDRTGQSGPKRW